MLVPVIGLARFFLREALLDAKNLIEKDAKKKVLQSAFPAVRDLLAEQLAESYSNYIKDLSTGYVQAVADMSLEASVKDEDSDKLVIIAENALKELEVFLEEQDQDGPIITYIKRRYEEEGVRKITGRLFAGHYIRKQSEGAFNIYNRMAYAPLVDKNKPWLSGETTAQGVSDIIADKANSIFEKAFDIDLSGEDILRS